MLLCLHCGDEYADEDPRIDDRAHVNFGGCPGCGARGVPADTADRVSVNITWQELRVLVIWAERWASAHPDNEPPMLEAVYGIADRLQAQHMDKPGLTFRSELADLSGAGFEYEQNVIREI